MKAPSYLRFSSWTNDGRALRLAYALAALAFLPTITFGFVLDDQAQIVMNPWITSWTFLPRYFTGNFWNFLHGPGVYYRPMFAVWLRLVASLVGFVPGWWHLVSIAVHIAATALVYAVGKRLLRDGLAAAWGAVVFAVYPIHAETVAWIASATELVAACLMLLGFWSYLRYRECGHRRWMVCTVVVCALAMFTKETCVVLPALIALYEWFFTEGDVRTRIRSCWSALWPMLPLLALYFAARYFALHGQFRSEHYHPLLTVVLQWPHLAWRYASLLVWPFGLSYYYDFQVTSNLSWSGVVLPALALLIAGLVLFRTCRSPLARFAASSIVLPMAPVFVGCYFWYQAEWIHDRYLYLSSIAPCLFLGWLLVQAWRRWPRPALVGGAMFIAALTVATAVQCLPWDNDLALYSHAVEVAPHSMEARERLAMDYADLTDYDNSLKQFDAILAMDPNNWVATLMKGSIYFRMNRFAEAEATFVHGLAVAGPQFNSRNAPAFFYLGLSRLRLGNPQQAEPALRQAIEYRPNSIGYHAALSQALRMQGRDKEAAAAMKAEDENRSSYLAQQQRDGITLQQDRP